MLSSLKTTSETDNTKKLTIYQVSINISFNFYQVYIEVQLTLYRTTIVFDKAFFKRPSMAYNTIQQR